MVGVAGAGRIGWPGRRELPVTDAAAITARLAERDQYHTDRAAWAKAKAPTWLRMIRSCVGEEERTRLWRLAGPELRKEITALAKAPAEPITQGASP